MEWERKQRGQLVIAQQRDAAANTTRKKIGSHNLGAPRAPAANGKTRIIHDARVGINDRADAPSMGQLDTLTSVVHQLQPGDYLWVSDLRAAFKNVRVVPWQLGLMAFAFLGTTYIDTRLTFGLNLAPLLYHACIGHPLLWMIFFLMQKEKIDGRIWQYVDDHLGAAPDYTRALRLRSIFGYTCELLGIEIEKEKDQPVSQSVRFLGMIVDTSGAAVTVTCPPEKLEKIRARLQRAVDRTWFSVAELESVCGMIGHVGVAIRGASVFSAELRKAISAAKASGSHTAFISPAMQADVQFWCEFASTWNGREVVLAQPTLPRGHLTADAMCNDDESAIGLFAFGRAFRIPLRRDRWGSTGRDIAVLELVALALLVTVCAVLLPNSMEQLVVSCMTDNSTVLHRVRKGFARSKSRNRPRANAILRFIWHVTAIVRLSFELSWIPSAENVLSDAPSRGDASRYAESVAVYNSDTFSNRAPPAWWPKGVQFRPADSSFATCDEDSALGALAERLGTQDLSSVRHVPSQMDHLLQRVRDFICKP